MIKSVLLHRSYKWITDEKFLFIFYCHEFIKVSLHGACSSGSHRTAAGTWKYAPLYPTCNIVLIRSAPKANPDTRLTLVHFLRSAPQNSSTLLFDTWLGSRIVCPPFSPPKSLWILLGCYFIRYFIPEWFHTSLAYSRFFPEKYLFAGWSVFYRKIYRLFNISNVNTNIHHIHRELSNL